ncbi:MAG: hypothetical protein U0744_10825 [Gemmataceae bacterium]
MEADRFRQQLERAWRESGLDQPVAKQPKQPIFRSMPEMPAAPTSIGDEAARPCSFLYMAKEDFRVGQYVCCLERCRRIMAMHSTTPAAADARRLSDEIQNDSAKTEALERSLAESLAAMHVAGAEQALKAGQWNLAQDHLQSAIRIAPNTASAAVAQTYLNRQRNGEALARP